jgi:serine/threonine protein kinase/tetratricopeptide (TPR) repeat protein
MSERDLFINALRITDPKERAHWLDVECSGDAALRRRIDVLLEAYEHAGSLLESPPLDGGPTADLPMEEEIGAAIGPYKLLEQIGEGGFGAVYLAEQATPVRRKVALKVLKLGMDTRQVVARFEAERQALAIMDHPNIARVFDGGVTPSGRPFFVMELVKGLPITEFCDLHKLTPQQRLELFIDVCQAVQHAHQKGIIHRDIKPSNVLVSRHDLTLVVKVIDFGVAKALGRELTDKTLFTGIAQMIGTPLYMSPEQAGMSDLDIDTRSDVYSLGVLLYELLTGATPFSKERFKQAAYDEIRRIIREEDPPKPSTRISESAETLPSVAANRGVEPRRLGGLMRGEIDWIVMKALEKDRSRRYETANGFAMDVQRYLAGEVVQACPPSTVYRLRTFARRNKGALAVAALVMFFMVLLGSGAGWAWRDRAAREAEVARQKGERQATASGQVEVIFAEVDQLGKEQKWSEALAAARRAEAVAAGNEADAETAERVHARLKDLEFIGRLEQARMHGATWVGRSFDHAGADREYARSFREYGVNVDELPVETVMERLKARPALAIPVAAALDDWAWARLEVIQRRADDAAAKRLVTIARGIDPEPLRDRMRASWRRPDSEVGDDLRRVAESIDVRAEHPTTLANLHQRLIQVKQQDCALRLLQDAQRAHPADFWLNLRLASQLRELKDYEGAVRFSTAAVSVRPHAVAALNNLGVALTDQKRLDEANAAFRKAIELDRNFATAYNNLSKALVDKNKLDEAVTVCRKAIELDPKFALAYYNLGVVLDKQRRLDETVAAYRKAIELDAKLDNAYNNLGIALEEQNKPNEAIALYRKAIEIYPESTQIHNRLGIALSQQNKLDEAIAAFHKAIELDAKFAEAHNNLGVNLFKQNKLDEASECFRKGVELNPNANTYTNLGLALNRQNKLDEAIAAFRKAVELDSKYILAHNNLGFALGKKAQQLRDRHNAAGCLAVAAEYEDQKPTDADAVYDAASIRALCAAAILKDPKTPAIDAARLAEEQADLAMDWLRKAVAAGYKNSSHMKQDEDLDALRGREDFKKLIADLEAKQK